MTDKITVRLGPLEKKFDKKLAQAGVSASRYVRELIATDLGEGAPEMTGHYQNLRQNQKKKKKS